MTPVSVVGPAYYADKLCERGRAYLRPLLIGRHALRPSKNAHDAWVQTLGTNLTNDQKRHDVAREISSGRYPTNTQAPMGGSRLWNQNGNQNPCNVNVKDTMFYV